MKAAFSCDESWHGGFYELAIELGERCDPRLAQALNACWDDPDVQGCYTSRQSEPQHQERVAPTFSLLTKHGHLLGIATLPTGDQVVCGSCAIREDDGPDWLVFYIPVAALSLTDSRVGGFPFGDVEACQDWRAPLDDWLARIASRIHATVPISLGLIGFEVSGHAYAREVEANGVPENRHTCYLVPSGNTLDIYPTTHWV
jgi:hypothetical protein